MAKTEWANWSQAIVSTMAVAFAAFGIWWQVWTQANLQDENRRREEVRLLKILGQFVFEVRAKLLLIGEEDLPHLHQKWAAVDGPIRSIKEVPFERYPAEKPVFTVATALLNYDFMRDAYAAIEHSSATREQVEHIEDSRERTIACFFRAECEIAAALVDRGAKLPRMRIGHSDQITIESLKADPVSV